MARMSSFKKMSSSLTIMSSVTTDLVTDNRVDKVCTSLGKMGYQVVLTGRRYQDSPVLAPRAYETRRMHLWFRKGPQFYAEYNVRLFFRLLFSGADVLLANDLDTLVANVLAGKLKRIPVVYDSHELFTGVPELVDRPRVRKIWQWIERKCLPHVALAFTVSPSIADHYYKQYGIPFRVVRNLPARNSQPITPTSPDVGSRPVIIYQGALNKGRGLESAIRAMEFLPEAQLVIAGAGDIEQDLKQMAAQSTTGNVTFKGRLTLDQLTRLTRTASLGISVEEDLGLNYRYALPNKLFDYIQARIPVVVSDLPEMRRIVEQYGIGMIATSNQPQTLASHFRTALFVTSLRTEWLRGLERAANELTWENEEKVLLDAFSKLVIFAFKQ